MWDECGMARTEDGLKKAMKDIKELRDDFWKNVNVPGGLDEMNKELEKAGRVADFLELGELFAKDALKEMSLAEDILGKNLQHPKRSEAK